MSKLTSVVSKLYKTPLKIKLILLISIFGIGFLVHKQVSKKTTSPIYQTSVVQKDTLINSVTGSGQVLANAASISTKATGVVKTVTVKVGDHIKAGDVIATLDLDEAGKQTLSSANASYQNSKLNFLSAQNKLLSLQSSMLENWKDYKALAENSTYTNSDGSSNNTNRNLPEFRIQQNGWLASEAEYKNQQLAIQSAQSSLNSSYLSFKESSSTITAPMSGVVSSITIQPGLLLTSSKTSITDISSKTIGSISTDSNPMISVNLTELDIPKLSIGNKATLTFDALEGKTFTGKVSSLDTAGSINSGVTTYSVVITLDTKPDNLFSNMSADVNIITFTKPDVLLVPSAAVTTQEGINTVQILQNDQPQTVEVQIGTSSDTETEIISGLNEGDIVITGTIAANSGPAITQSPFSTFGSNRGFAGGGGAVRISR